MMIYTPVTARQLPDRTPIPVFQGTLTRLWDAKSGVGKYGHWVIQGGKFLEGDTELDVTFRFEADQSWVGKVLRITAAENKKGLPIGLTMALNKYRDKEGNPVEQLRLDVTKSAKVEVLDARGSVETSGGDDDIPGLEKPATTPTKPQNVPVSADCPPPNGIDTVKRDIHLAANLYELCLARAVLTTPLWEQLTGEQMTPEQFQGYLGTLFIEGLRSGQHRKLPMDVKPHIAALMEVLNKAPEA